MAWCLLKPLADLFKQKVASGEIKPERLEKMSSAERQVYLSKFLGEENARQVNREMNDRRLGKQITEEEARKILELSKSAKALREKAVRGIDRIEYGTADTLLNNYIQSLKPGNEHRNMSEYLANPLLAISDASGFAKSIKASFDNSAIFRQGWKTIFTDTAIWGKNAAKSFSDIAKALGGVHASDALRAELVSRDNALNGTYDLMKLDLGTSEEARPTSLPARIPVLGKLFDASEQAYNNFLRRMRADIADKLVAMAQEQGVSLKDEEQIRSIGKVVNSLTGRGDLGKAEDLGKVINTVFFSPKFFKSQLDVMTAHGFGYGLKGDFARKTAAKNLLRIVAGNALVLALANKLFPGQEEDPTSTDFGKLKIGSTRFDLSGGMGSFLTLAARIATQSSKSSSGVKHAFGSGFGQTTGMDVLAQFFENKASPAGSLLIDLINQSDRMGNPLTVGGELANFIAPLGTTTAYDLLKDPNSAPFLISMIADSLGISTNTYSASKDWSVNPGKEITQFKEKVGDAKFKEANDAYNSAVHDKIDELLKSDKFNALSDDDKAKVVTDVKSNIKDRVFKDYNFTYRQEKKKANPLVKKLAE